MKSGLKKQFQNLCDGQTENQTNYHSLIVLMSEIFQN